MPEQCGTCRFGEELDVDGRDPILACHRFPPQTVQVEIDSDDAISGLTMFPNVAPEDWCGEYQADASAVNPAPGPDEAYPVDG